MSEHATLERTATSVPRASSRDRLVTLRSRIAQVGRRRRFMRRLSAVSRIVVAVLIAAATLFLVDWIFAPGRLARLLMLGVAAAAIARVYWRRVRAGLMARESDVDIALLIEKQQGIDSDLVAALEFANGRAAPGSADLRDAVVDYVADFGRSWKMPREAVDPKLRRRLGWLALAVAVVGTAVAVRPDFAAAFVNRMLLGLAHYPTRTRIESLTIGGQRVDPSPWAAASVRSPLGRPLAFEVGIGGEPPRLVRLRLASAETGGTTEIELVSDAAGSSNTYAAKLPRLAESVDVQVFAGDAWTEPVRVRAMTPPLVDVALAATPPVYAGSRVERAAQGARQVTVLEGSRVDLTLRCTNKKLASATLVVDGVEHPLTARTVDGAGAGGRADEWGLSGSESPLARLERSTTYEVRIVDEDGLGADAPLVGSIRVKPDAPPRVTAEVQTRLVLPTASPRLAWRVADDHAIAQLEIVVEPVSSTVETGEDGTSSGVPTSSRPGRSATIAVPLSAAGDAGWVGGDRLPLEGIAPVKLDGLGLQVGDQVRIFVRAVDYRGDAAGRAAESEPILLEVTDERGILAALTESDEQSIEQIDAIIDRELSVGGAR